MFFSLLPKQTSSSQNSVRRPLSPIVWAWGFGAVWMYITTGAVFTRFAKALDVSEFGFGVLAAMLFFGALAQLPASYVLERFGHRKTIFVVVGVFHRLLWTMIAAISWFVSMEW
jgi:sulfite exporter TauE/SafE